MLALASMTYNTYLGLAVLAKARWLQALWLQAAVSSFTALCICNWHCVTGRGNSSSLEVGCHFSKPSSPWCLPSPPRQPGTQSASVCNDELYISPSPERERGPPGYLSG